jgi:threonine aldolase
MLDFRSDTVTKPTKGMKEAMFSAPVGDDVYEEDESVNALQEKIAALFGKEAALFCPSGTMSNQLALRALTRPGEEVICHSGAHVYKYEGGGLSANSGLSVRTLEADFGILTPQMLENNINPDDVHFPASTVLVIENTVNRGGGAVYSRAETAALSAKCRERGLFFHLDGARIFNALVYSKISPAEYGQYFDSISICLSKGLGCPVGSLLTGTKAMIKRAKKLRKMTGGGMRQAGFLAAAGIYALDNHVERLAQDHDLAARTADVLRKKDFIADIYPVKTNIVIFELDTTENADKFADLMQKSGILLNKIEPKKFRIVTHLDCPNDADDILRTVLDKF